MQEPFEIYPYRRVGTKQNEQTMRHNQYRQRVLWFWRQWSRPRAIFCILIAFLLGRAVVAEQIAPFGLAFLAVVLGRDRPLILPILISILIGEATAGFFGPFWYNSVIYVSFIGVFQVLEKRIRRPFWLGLFTAGWSFGVKAGLSAMLHNPVPYDYLRIVIEATMVGALVPPFYLVIREIKRPKKDFGRLQEEVGSMLLLVLALVLGLNFAVGGYNIGVILTKFLVMLAALGGVGWGAAFGGACGLIPGLINLNGLVLAGLYSISGMLAGFLKHWGKWGLLLGFFCGNLLYGFYFSDEMALISFLETSGLAALLLLVIPKTIIHNITYRWFRQTREPSGSLGPMEDKLDRLITLFQELANSYSKAAVTVNREDAWERLLGGVINRVCRDCPLSRICWEKEVYQSYQHLLNWLSALETGKAEAPLEFMPMDLQKRCRRSEELATAMFYLTAIEKTNSYWHEKMHKERQAVATQLGGAARVLAATREKYQVKAPKHQDFEEAIHLELEEMGLHPEKLEVWPGKYGGLEIHLELEPCEKKKSSCVKEVLACLENVLGLPIVIDRHHCPGQEKGGSCYFRLLALSGNRPEIGIAQWPKDGYPVCGDSVIATGLDQNRWLFLISDGMGSGEVALHESNSVVRLLEQLLALEFSLREAIEMVNALLLLDREERFATIDLAVLDLHQGRLEFVKIGAVPSLLIQEGKSQVLEANSLPAGILEEIPIETISFHLQPGDVLIMVSDGVWQGHPKGYKEGWLPAFVEGIWHLEPEELAERIVEHAMILHGGKAEDDLSALVVKIDRA